MAHGNFEGKDVHDPAIRRLFTLEALQSSDWFRKRLAARQRADERLWRRLLATLDTWLAENGASPLTTQMRQRRQHAAEQLERVASPAYLNSLNGTLGVDPALDRARV
jgi:hypothetical protein